MIDDAIFASVAGFVGSERYHGPWLRKRDKRKVTGFRKRTLRGNCPVRLSSIAVGVVVIVGTSASFAAFSLERRWRLTTL